MFDISNNSLALLAALVFITRPTGAFWQTVSGGRSTGLHMALLSIHSAAG